MRFVDRAGTEKYSSLLPEFVSLLLMIGMLFVVVSFGESCSTADGVVRAFFRFLGNKGLTSRVRSQHENKVAIAGAKLQIRCSKQLPASAPRERRF